MWEQVKGMLALPQDESQRAAAKQGLLAAGAAMMNGRGNFVGMLGEGLGTGMQGYHGALAQQQQTALRQAQMQQVGLENQQREAEMARPGRIAGALAGVGTPPGIQPISSLPRLGQSAGEGTQSVSRTLPPAASPEYLVNYYRQRGDALMNVDVDAAKIQYDLAEKQRAKLMKRETLIRNGKPVSVLTYEDGREMDSTYDALPDNQVVDMGGSQAIIDRNLPQAGTQFAKSASPEALLSAETARRGQNMSDVRAREANAINRQGQQSQLINDPTQGPILVDKGTGQARQVMMNGQAVQGEAAAKREASAENLIPLLKQGVGLIDGATGSYWGTAIDHGARLFGGATGGAEKIAQLRVLEGNIMMAQPRMEGPQSNLDVDLYRQMAAQIGDPTVPNSTKKLALATVYDLYKKYDPSAGEKDNPFAEKTPAPKVRDVKDLPKKTAAPQAYTDAEKERRYQEWKRSQK